MTQPANQRAQNVLTDADVERLYALVPCGYAAIAYDGPILEINAGFCSWIGYSSVELTGIRSFSDLLTPAGRVYQQTHLQPKLLIDGAVWEIAVDIVCADGSRLPVLMNATLERDAQGVPHTVRVAVFKATERRAYEQELFRAKERAEASEEHTRVLARTLQQTLIPPALPVVPGLEIAASYRPAGDGEEVGGDFYDVFQIRRGEWVIVLGDVCGKGVDAAVVTALMRHSLRAVFIDHPSPSSALSVLNQIVLAHDSDRFCTLVLLRLQQDGDRWLIDMCAAGHPAPILVRPDQQSVAVGTPSPLVGVFADPHFTDSGLILEPGDMLVLYTDGVTEGRRDLEFFGEQRMLTSLDTHRRDVSHAVDGLLTDVLDFQRGRTRDDIAVVALAVPAQPGQTR